MAIGVTTWIIINRCNKDESRLTRYYSWISIIAINQGVYSQIRFKTCKNCVSNEAGRNAFNFKNWKDSRLEKLVDVMKGGLTFSGSGILHES